MDEMKLKLSGGFMRGIVTKLISKLIYDKLGYKISVEVNEVGITTVDGKVRLHLNANANMSDTEFVKLAKAIGLD